MNTPNQQPGTHHGLVPGFLPMSPQDGLDQFRVSGTMAVRSLLRELQGLPVLGGKNNVGCDVGCHVVTRSGVKCRFHHLRADRLPGITQILQQALHFLVLLQLVVQVGLQQRPRHVVVQHAQIGGNAAHRRVQ